MWFESFAALRFGFLLRLGVGCEPPGVSNPVVTCVSFVSCRPPGAGLPASKVCGRLPPRASLSITPGSIRRRTGPSWVGPLSLRCRSRAWRGVFRGRRGRLRAPPVILSDGLETRLMFRVLAATGDGIIHTAPVSPDARDSLDRVNV
jgi:hypothetical protein